MKSIQQSDVFLVIDIILASDNSSRFRKNHLGRTLKLIMKIENNIIGKKLQHSLYK